MKFLLTRNYCNKDTTIGTMTIDGHPDFCIRTRERRCPRERGSYIGLCLQEGVYNLFPAMARLKTSNIPEGHYPWPHLPSARGYRAPGFAADRGQALLSGMIAYGKQLNDDGMSLSGGVEAAEDLFRILQPIMDRENCRFTEPIMLVIRRAEDFTLTEGRRFVIEEEEELVV